VKRKGETKSLVIFSSVSCSICTTGAIDADVRLKDLVVWGSIEIGKREVLRFAFIAIKKEEESYWCGGGWGKEVRINR